jgi:hypothetical protein
MYFDSPDEEGQLVRPITESTAEFLMSGGRGDGTDKNDQAWRGDHRPN